MICEPEPSGSDAEPAAPEPSGDWGALFVWLVVGFALCVVLVFGIVAIGAVGCEGGESDLMEQGEP